MAEPLRMTPGPTEVPDRVRRRMAEPSPNPDVEPEFEEFYIDLVEKAGLLMATDNDVVILGGEGILGLEAAVASTIEPGDPVLCLSNGLYGSGFADFVEQAGGEPTVDTVSDRRPLDPERVKAAIGDQDFVAATMVHCETPTGMLNDLDEILGILSDAGILTIVDAVSSVGGVPVPVDEMDVCIGGSQKCLSSPPGLTLLSVSDATWDRVGDVDQRSFYTSLAPWEGHPRPGELLPYTPLTANLQALDESIDLILGEGLDAVFDRHRLIANACLNRLEELGASPFVTDPKYSSPTVTAVEIDGSASEIQETVAREHDIILSTGLGEHSDDILRIGHMGANARMELLDRTLTALSATPSFPGGD